jgi:hypothetical protein
MKAVRRYSWQFEADLGRIALEGVGIPAVVVGVGMSMDGGVAVAQCGTRRLSRNDIAPITVPSSVAFLSRFLRRKRGPCVRGEMQRMSVLPTVERQLSEWLNERNGLGRAP